MPEMIVAVFDTASEAEAAIRDVEAARLPSVVTQRYAKDDPELRDYAGEDTGRKQGFWSWLLGEDAPAHEHAVYDRSLGAGGTIVTATVDEEYAPQVLDILERHSPIDIDERASHYGIAPASTGALGEAGYAEAGVGTSTYGAEPGATDTLRTGTARVGAAGSTETGATMRTGEEVIPLRQEELEIGKRTVDRGTTRVRRYVVRTPVEQQVNLRDETVTMERRRPVAPGTPGVPEGAFEERTVEVRTTTEEPVVSKSARVAEEVVIRKDVTERTETVRDTVRREEVQVDKDGTASTSTTSTGR